LWDNLNVQAGPARLYRVDLDLVKTMQHVIALVEQHGVLVVFLNALFSSKWTASPHYSDSTGSGIGCGPALSTPYVLSVPI
jgi:hypothetical protein